MNSSQRKVIVFGTLLWIVLAADHGLDVQSKLSSLINLSGWRTSNSEPEVPEFIHVLESGTLTAAEGLKTSCWIKVGQVEPPKMVGDCRSLALAYGLAEAEQPTATRIRLFCGRASTQKPFAITVYIKEAGQAQSVTLHLPNGLTLLDGQQAEQRVPPVNENGYSQVSWRVRASQAGKYSVRAEAPGIGKTEESIQVIEPGNP